MSISVSFWLNPDHSAIGPQIFEQPHLQAIVIRWDWRRGRLRGLVAHVRGGNAHVLASLHCSYYLLLTLAGLQRCSRFGRLLSSSSMLILLFFCLLLFLAKQWWSLGNVGNRTDIAWKLSPKPIPLLMTTLHTLPVPNRDLTTSSLSLGIYFQFYFTLGDPSNHPFCFCGYSKVRFEEEIHLPCS